MQDVDQVTSDNHGGLRNAIKKHFANAVWQRCQTHFSRNVMNKTPKKLQAEMKQALKDMYDAPDLEKAEIRKTRFWINSKQVHPRQ